MSALGALAEHRPAASEILLFLEAVLSGKKPPPVRQREEGESRTYDYLLANGALALLKPALVCCARHRPENPRRYVALFVTTAVAMLK
eukprot:SAG11_NODE_5967_length_1423_cov_1.439577_1_plen_88_part_00